MKKHFKIFVLTLAVVGLISASAFAGTITLSNNAAGTATARVVAKEVVEGGTSSAPASLNIGTAVAGYKPTSIALGSLVDPVINITVSTGKLTVAAGVTPQLCTTTAGGTIIANYSSGSGTATLVFQPVTGQSISNNVTYNIGKTNCGAVLAAGDLAATLPPGTTSDTLTIAAGAAATQVTHDSATASIATVKYQYTSSVTTKADAKIDPTAGFKKFVNAATTDTIVVTDVDQSTVSLFDTTVTTNASDKSTIKFNLSDVSGLTTTSVAMGAYTCALDLTTKVATCTLTGAYTPAANTATFTIDTTTVLAERTFTVTNEVDFNTATMQDHTVALGTALLTTGTDAGNWLYNGQTIYVPLIKSAVASGVETYIKLQSSDATSGANGISAVILCGDGTTITTTMGTITPGIPFTISGADLMAKVTAAGKTVSGSAGFAVKLNVYSAAGTVYGYANTLDPATGNKRVPLSTVDGVSN